MTDSIGGPSGLRLADDCWRSGALQAAIFSSVPEIVQSVALSRRSLWVDTRFGSCHGTCRLESRGMRRGDSASVASGGSGGDKSWSGRGVTSLNALGVSGGRNVRASDAVSESAASASSTGSWMRKGA